MGFLLRAPSICQWCWGLDFNTGILEEHLFSDHSSLPGPSSPVSQTGKFSHTYYRTVMLNLPLWLMSEWKDRELAHWRVFLPSPALTRPWTWRSQSALAPHIQGRLLEQETFMSLFVPHFVNSCRHLCLEIVCFLHSDCRCLFSDIRIDHAHNKSCHCKRTKIQSSLAKICPPIFMWIVYSWILPELGFLSGHTKSTSYPWLDTNGHIPAPAPWWFSHCFVFVFFSKAHMSFSFFPCSCSN